MISSIRSAFSPRTFSGMFDSWSSVTRSIGKINKALNFIGRDPDKKSIDINLSNNERDMIFSIDNGSIGMALLNTTLIMSESRNYASFSSGFVATRYEIADISTSDARLYAYNSSGYKGSERVDYLI